MVLSSIARPIERSCAADTPTAVAPAPTAATSHPVSPSSSRQAATTPPAGARRIPSIMISPASPLIASPLESQLPCGDYMARQPPRHNHDDVETDIERSAVGLLCHRKPCGPRQALPLRRRDREQPQRLARPRLHLHHNKNAAAPCQDVDLAERRAQV